MGEETNSKIKIREKAFWIIQLAFYCIIGLAVAYLIVTFVCQRTVVDGNSMYNTLSDGDNILVDKLSYRFGDIERYDIVIFPHIDEETGEEVHYIKRVIGMPGEIIQIRDGAVYLLDEEGHYEQLPDEYGYLFNGEAMLGYYAREPVTIPEDSYFVLGDNRNNSKDSRHFGVVKREDILGKAWIRFYPFSSFKFIGK